MRGNERLYGEMLEKLLLLSNSLSKSRLQKGGSHQIDLVLQWLIRRYPGLEHSSYLSNI